MFYNMFCHFYKWNYMCYDNKSLKLKEKCVFTFIFRYVFVCMYGFAWNSKLFVRFLAICVHICINP